MEENKTTEKGELIVLHKVLGAVNQCLGKRGQPKVEYPDILNCIKENYKDFPVDKLELEEQIWFKSIPKGMADSIRAFYCEGVDFPPDFEEHIYIAFPIERISIHVPLYPREYVKAQHITPLHPDYADYVEKKKYLSMRANTYGVIDLAHYKREFPQGTKEEKETYTMRFYADWILNAYNKIGAKEVPYDEFSKGEVLLSPKEETDGVIKKIREKMMEIKKLPGTELGEQAKGLLKEISTITSGKE